MKKVKLLCILFILLIYTIFLAKAEQKYNPWEKRWETVPDNGKWEIRHNPWENDWSYQPNNAQIEHNPYEKQWEWDSGHNENEED